MAISDSEKLDLLFKKIGFGVSKTASADNKGGPNETIPSPIIVSPSNIWGEADSIGTTPPTSTNNVIRLYVGEDAIRCTTDPTAPANQTWLATTSYGTPSSRVGNFIPTTYGSGYLAKVYIGNPVTGPATRIYPSTTNEEYYFDYTSGVLTFFNNIPAGKTAEIGSGTVSVAANGIYVEVYRYIGSTGFIPLDNGKVVKLIVTHEDDGAREIGIIPSGYKIVEVLVEIVEEFDGDFSLTVGDASNNEAIMSEDMTDENQLGIYGGTASYEGTDDRLYVYASGNSTQGIAQITVNYF